MTRPDRRCSRGAGFQNCTWRRSRLSWLLSVTSVVGIYCGGFFSRLFHQADVFLRQLIRQMVQKLAHGKVRGRVPTLAWDIGFPYRLGRFCSHWALLMIDADYHTI